MFKQMSFLCRPYHQFRQFTMLLIGRERLFINERTNKIHIAHREPFNDDYLVTYCGSELRSKDAIEITPGLEIASSHELGLTMCALCTGQASIERGNYLH